MRPRRKASGTARGEGLRGPAPLDSPPDAKAEPWNHHAAMTSPQGVPIRPGTPPRKTDGTGAPASVTHAVRLTAPDAMGSWTRFARGSDCVFPLRAPLARSTGCRLRPPTVGFGRGTELAQPLAPFEFSFGPSGYAGLIIPASRLPSTLPCLLADPRPLTGTALAGNAIA